MDFAFLFPGQGAQKVGMGKEVAEAFPDTAGRIFARADEILGIPLSSFCFEGPDEELARTEITQPALLTTSVAILSVLKRLGIEPLAAAGHSVGEYAALVSTGAIAFDDALPVVRLRGQLMAQAVAETPGAMAAIMGLDFDQVEAVCHEASARGVVEPSNLNTPTQVVISGQTEAVLEAMESAKEQGGKAVRLNVSAPFHCSLMAPVRDALAPAVEAMPVHVPIAPVIANATALPVSEPERIREALLDQIESPVRWTDTMRYFLNHGQDSFLEVGPGKVLAGLFRSMDRAVQVTGVGTPSDIEQLIAE